MKKEIHYNIYEKCGIMIKHGTPQKEADIIATVIDDFTFIMLNDLAKALEIIKLGKKE